MMTELLNLVVLKSNKNKCQDLFAKKFMKRVM